MHAYVKYSRPRHELGLDPRCWAAVGGPVAAWRGVGGPACVVMVWCGQQVHPHAEAEQGTTTRLGTGS
jgi:hypothetical protein